MLQSKDAPHYAFYYFLLYSGLGQGPRIEGQYFIFVHFKKYYLSLTLEPQSGLINVSTLLCKSTLE